MLEIAKIKDNLYKETCPIIINKGSILQSNEQIFANLSLKNISPNRVTSMMVDLHIFDKANNEVQVLRDYLYLVDKVSRDEDFGEDILIELEKESSFTMSVAITRVEYFEKDVWTGTSSMFFQSIPSVVSLEEEFEEKATVEQYQRDFAENMAENKDIKAIVAPLEYKDLWVCSCSAINNEKEEKCHICGALFALQKEHVANRLQLDSNLKAYQKEIADKAEKLRQEAKRKVDELQEAKEKAIREAKEEKEKYEEQVKKAKKKKRIILSITIPSTIAICVFLYFLNSFIIPNSKYNKAMEMIDNEEFVEALAAFEELGSFSDSANMSIETKYLQAQDVYQEESFDEAIAIFEEIQDFKDVENEINLCKYDKATVLFNNAEYEQALVIFTEIEDYSNSSELIDNCNYQLSVENIDCLSVSLEYFICLSGELSTNVQNLYFDTGSQLYALDYFEEAETYFVNITDSQIVEQVEQLYYDKAIFYMEEKEYDQAIEILTALGSFSDSETQLFKINYLIAEEYLLQEDYVNAKEYFILAETYEDSQEKSNLCAYQIALATYNSGEYEEASLLFQDLGEYEDSQTWVNKSIYAYGLELLDSGEVMDAYTTLYEIKNYYDAYLILISKSEFYRYIYDVGNGSNPLYE